MWVFFVSLLFEGDVGRLHENATHLKSKIAWTFSCWCFCSHCHMELD